MGKKKKNQVNNTDSSIYEIFSEFKSPDWNPFPFQTQFHEVFIPNESEIKNLINPFRTKLKYQKLKTIYWYLLLVKYSQITVSEQEYNLYEDLLSNEIETENSIGFYDVIELLNSSGKKKIKRKDKTYPDIFSTFYALAALKYIGRLSEYLLSEEERKRKKLVKFLDSLVENSQIYHCFNPQCKICRQTPEPEIIFYIFLCYDLLGIHPRNRSTLFIPLLKNSKNQNRYNSFRLLSLRYLSSKTYIKEDDLIKLHKIQQSDGGFEDVDNTFWIGQTFKAYEWLIPFQAGPIFSYLVRNINAISKNNSSPNEFSNQIVKISQAVVLMTGIFELLTNEIEELLFTNMPAEMVIDLDTLSIHGGLKGAEEAVIKYINSKYSLTLEIFKNEERFGDYLSGLQYPHRDHARELCRIIQNQPQLDIKAFRKYYNKGRYKKDRIDDNSVISLISDMKKQHFFDGQIIKRNRLFSTNIIFNRDRFIKNVIVSNRIVKYSDLKFEKERLNEVSKNIFNMTREMEESSQNIMLEVESLIIASQIELAEERLRFNIKYNITKALFFEENIKSFQEEFKIIRVKALLSPLIDKWNKIYSNLQRNFSNISNVLSIKIDELKEEQEQYQLSCQLEQHVNHKIHFVIEEFDNFQKIFRSNLESNYSREVVLSLLSALNRLEETVSKSDQGIQKKSFHITNKATEVSSLRQKVINLWVSNLKEFQNSTNYYHLGFSLWKEKISLLGKKDDEIIKYLDLIKQNTKDLISKKKYKSALSTIERKFIDISKDIESFSQSLKKEIDKYYKKNRKLGPLIQNIITEWGLIRNRLENSSQDMQFDLQNSVEMDKKKYKIEMFRLSVEKEITKTRQNFIEFERNLNSMIQRGQCNQQSFDEKYSKLEINISNIKGKLEKQLLTLKKSFTIEVAEINSIWGHWEEFINDSNQNLLNLKEKYLDEEVLSTIFKYAKEQKTNYITLFIIAKFLTENEKILKDRIINLINSDRINARLIDETPVKIELHNTIWRMNERLTMYTDVIFRDLEVRFTKYQRYYENSIINNQFLRDVSQIQAMTTNFNEKLTEISENYDDFLKQNRIDIEFQLLKENSQNFRKKIKDYDSIIKDMKIACEKTSDYDSFLNSRLLFLERNIINSEISRINQELKSRDKIDYKSNVEWLKTQKNLFKSKMMKLSSEIENFKKSNALDFPQTASIIADLEKNFNSSKQEFIEKYHITIDDISDKLNALDLKKLGNQIEEVIKNKQDDLNQILSSYNLEIRNKIRSKDYFSAAKKITKFLLIDKNLKTFDKEIKSINKNLISKNKVWEIKGKIVLEEWNRYKEYFQDTIKSQYIALQTELILQYTLFAVKALKGNFIPLNKIVQDLNIKHETIQHTLMGLIGDNILKGRIHLTYDIYLESDSADFDDDTIAALDITRSSNVKFYLLLQRIANVFSLIAPLLAAIASILTIVFYLTKFAEFEPIVIFIAAFIVIISIIIFIWLRKGKSKAMKGNLI
ncbi:hypothetical protein DSAG12_02389 [Promethearchaeum syntrophicum]|uniref:Uncharacterized protein n=1 Tax=Promethearchaeum syntrophicum TaxID=2594042 RepID=A0A5B9DBD4_9ARCH|nr:hypothetical protein [Candidatus Prometheoarchaeum syntrophicum]QEE16559.1 hypothetical protein DSAG12_02389 [Candidatus Prometheoarchaeum syntrophicum]